MVYNKTKRGLEKAAGIVGVITSALEIVGGLACVILGILYYAGTFNETLFDYVNGSYEVVGYAIYVYLGTPYLVLGLLLLAMSIVTLVCCAKIIKTPLLASGTVKPRNGIRITALVFTILNGSWVTAGLLIAVLCLKDFVDEQATEETCATMANNDAKAENDFYTKIKEVKHLKELGIIDETIFKKSINKIVDDIINE